VNSWRRAANDNRPSAHASSPSPLLSRGSGAPLLRSEPFRIGARPLLIVGFSGLILVALCGAFLVGLAAVGVLAAGIGAFELARRTLRRKTRLGALDHQVAG
jgi:hypothetical protein